MTFSNAKTLSSSYLQAPKTHCATLRKTKAKNFCIFLQATHKRTNKQVHSQKDRKKKERDNVRLRKIEKRERECGKGGKIARGKRERER